MRSGIGGWYIMTRCNATVFLDGHIKTGRGGTELSERRRKRDVLLTGCPQEHLSLLTARRRWVAEGWPAWKKGSIFVPVQSRGFERIAFPLKRFLWPFFGNCIHGAYGFGDYCPFVQFSIPEISLIAFVFCLCFSGVQRLAQRRQRMATWNAYGARATLGGYHITLVPFHHSKPLRIAKFASAPCLMNASSALKGKP